MTAMTVIGSIDFAARSVQAMTVPVKQFMLAEAPDPGTLLDFPSGGETREVPVPVPFLPGMDEVEVGAATAAIGTRAVERTTDHPGPAGTSATLTFTPPVAGAPVGLLRIEIEGFSAGNEAMARSLAAPGLALFWPPGSAMAQTDPLVAAQALHLLVSAASGPPFLGVPHFPMPGAGGALYGNALGGCSLSATRASNGAVRLVLTPQGAAPPLAAVKLTVVRLAPDAPRLPNEGAPVPWRATAIRAVWQLHPAALKVEAALAGGGRAVMVAEMPGDPVRRVNGFDFAAALRGLARPAYDAATGAMDLGLALRVTATGPGAARLRLDSAGLRYLRRPLVRPERLALRGAAVAFALAGAAPGLVPDALDLAVDGTFLPERLTDASDDTPHASRQGLMAEGTIRLARRTSLTPTEQALPIARVAVFGRAAADAEVLLTLHAGDVLRVGAPLGPSVALTLLAGETASWHLAPLATPLAGPLPPVVWLVLAAPRGRFLWHGAATNDDTALLSGDGGGSWTDGAIRPAMQIAVREPEAIPLPLPLRWDAAGQGQASGSGGTISPDAASGEGPTFRRRVLLAGPSAAAALEAVAQAPLNLAFACRRDVDLAVSEATFAYNPWAAAAGGTQP
ncbi:MAG: hypothetical protein IT555_05875 [Acetobacteraceae bacterium]|nr:hypothetical protein [Acetobacteraceae bacterium]